MIETNMRRIYRTKDIREFLIFGHFRVIVHLRSFQQKALVRLKAMAKTQGSSAKGRVWTDEALNRLSPYQGI
jgi:hypothetical protein